MFRKTPPTRYEYDYEYLSESVSQLIFASTLAAVDMEQTANIILLILIVFIEFLYRYRHVSPTLFDR